MFFGHDDPAGIKTYKVTKDETNMNFFNPPKGGQSVRRRTREW